MNYKLVKLHKLSGYKTSIYSVFLEEEQKTLFDRFLEENKISFISELNEIYSRLYSIGHDTGARLQFFKIHEGKPGDGVCALFDMLECNLRLYCIRYGALILILGGGGYKPKSMKSFQEDNKLTEENYFLQQLSLKIKQKMDEGEISFSDDFMDFKGNLEFNDEDYE